MHVTLLRKNFLFGKAGVFRSLANEPNKNTETDAAHNSAEHCLAMQDAYDADDWMA